MTDSPTNPPREVRLSVWITAGVIFAVLVSLWQGLKAEPESRDPIPAVETGAAAPRPSPDSLR